MKRPYHKRKDDDNMEDKQIIELFFARDERAIHETDVKYGRLCTSVSYRILANLSDAEECVNDTYLNTWNRIPPTVPHYFSAFLCKIVQNLSLKKLDYLTAKKRCPEVLVSLEELEAVLPDEQMNPSMESEALGRIISQFLRTEKAEARNVFLRKYLFMDSVSDIAARYGYEESKVKSMLFRTRSRLRAYLKEEGVEV